MNPTLTESAFMCGHNQYGSRRAAKMFARLKGWAENAAEFDSLIQRVQTQYGQLAIEQEIQKGFRTIWVVQCDQPYTIITQPGESPGIADCRRVSAMVRIGDLRREVERVEAIARANARVQR